MDLVIGGGAPVKGIFAQLQTFAFFGGYETGGTAVDPSNDKTFIGRFMVKEDPDNPGFPGIFAELESKGIILTLANIEMAKKTAAFAEIRRQMKGLDDDHIIDLLMAGIRVPDVQLAQPILFVK